MRYALAVLVIVASGCTASGASDEEFAQTIRAASRFEAIARICPSIIPTDVDRARIYASVYIAALEKVASNILDEMMPAEIKRRISEVEITGEKRWCEDQRRYLYEIGAGEVFPVARYR